MSTKTGPRGKQIVVWLPPETQKTFRMYLLKHDLRLKDVVEIIITEWLAKRQAEEPYL